MINGLALLAYWPVRQTLNHVSSVQFGLVTSLCTRLKPNQASWKKMWTMSHRL